jgi:hypothetical protein
VDIPVKAEVECVDGSCGRSSSVVIDRVTQRVTHLVVEAQVYPRIERVVDVKLIRESTPKVIKLSCNRAEFDALPEFKQVDFESGPETWENYVPGEYLFSPGAPGAVGEVPIEHENVPIGGVALRAGSRVSATDGEVGHVVDLITDPLDNHLTHIVIEHRGFIRSHRITVPADQISSITPDGIVSLKLDRHAVELLQET